MAPVTHDSRRHHAVANDHYAHDPNSACHYADDH
jgi:hypothetical protein